jgi:hypothetical protein
MVSIGYSIHPGGCPVSIMVLSVLLHPVKKRPNIAMPKKIAIVIDNVFLIIPII